MIPSTGLALALAMLTSLIMPAANLARADTVRAEATVAQFYQQRNGALAWTGAANQAAYRDLVAAIGSADRHGLDPADYHLVKLKDGDPGTADPHLDRLATDAYLTLAAHLHSGRLDPLTIEPDWTAGRRERDLVAYLESSLGNGAIDKSLEALAPTDRGYLDLKQALSQYRAIARRGGWPPVDAGPVMRLGDRGPRIHQLRERLLVGGDLASLGSDPQAFDVALEDAVRRFQRRANQAPDGVVGTKTLAQLNTRVDERIAQIRANMERWRWLPDDLGRRHIRVNIADFRLEAHADGKVARTHEVIVGRLYRKTPIFSGTMTYLVFNPWWETPPKLAAQDKLPVFRKDPQSVEALGFQVISRSGELIDPKTIDWSAVPATDFPYRIRQAPGPQNALGDVKFMFPNRHNVYLHDTPTRGLFAQTRRDFSSGCVRVRDALDLAAWVLADTPEWGPARIDHVTAGERETRVTLAQPLPVHILYFTVVSDDDTVIRFIDDIYGRDQKLISALDR